MTDLGIIGGGFWGITAAVMAEERGYDVTVWDANDELAASPAAAGIIQLWWYDSVTTSKMLPEWWRDENPAFGLEWLAGHVRLLDTGELYSSYQGADGRFRDDCYIVEECEELLNAHPVDEARVERIDPPSDGGEGEGWTVHFEDERPAETVENLLVAAGAWTDDLLRRSELPPVGVEPLRGRAVLLDPHEYEEAPPTAHDAEKDTLPGSMPSTTPHTILPRPYTHFTLRPYRGHYRIGDTTEQDIGGNENSLQELLLNAGKLVGGFDVVEVYDGVRPVADTITVEPIQDGHPGGVVATGGHRVGLLLAPICARRALRLLGLWGEGEDESEDAERAAGDIAGEP